MRTVQRTGTRVMASMVEAAIAKGKYGDFDAFLSGEAVRYLKIYFEIRRQGSSVLPPEDIIERFYPTLENVTFHPSLLIRFVFNAKVFF